MIVPVLFPHLLDSKTAGIQKSIKVHIDDRQIRLDEPHQVGAIRHPTPVLPNPCNGKDKVDAAEILDSLAECLPLRFPAAYIDLV